MNKILMTSAFAAIVLASPAYAQTTTTTSPPTSVTGLTPATPNPSTSGSAASTSSEAPGNTTPSPVERNRLDPSAPSELRTQIDNGASSAAVVSPDAPAPQAVAPGESYNTILEGAPSTNGVSTGTSGMGTGVTINPVTPPISSPSESISRAGLPSGAMGAGVVSGSMATPGATSATTTTMQRSGIAGTGMPTSGARMGGMHSFGHSFSHSFGSRGGGSHR